MNLQRESSELRQAGSLVDQAKTLSRSSNPVDRLKAHQILSKTGNRVTIEANGDSFRAQLKLGQASQMLDRMSQYSSMLFSMHQHFYASFR